MATIIDGKKIAAEVRAELKEKIEKMVAETKRRPALAVILVGEDPASKVRLSVFQHVPRNFRHQKAGKIFRRL